MSRRYLLYLRDMEQACLQVREFADGLTYEEFTSHGMPYHALVRLIEVIGEAAKAVPEEARARHPEVEWRRIGRTRDIMAHHYFSLEDETLWEIIQQHIPELSGQLGPIMKDESTRNESTG